MFVDVIKSVIPVAEELAGGLDKFRHQIRLDDINQFKLEDSAGLVNVFQQNAKLSKEIKVEMLMDQVIIAASAISEIDNTTSTQLKIMEEYVPTFELLN